MEQFDRARFDHIGLVTDEPKPGEVFVEEAGVWATSPRAHPFNVHWLRFAPDSPAPEPFRTQAHVAYRVDDLEAALESHELVMGPEDIGGGFAKVAFVMVDGVLVEFMQYANPDETGWF